MQTQTLKIFIQFLREKGLVTNVSCRQECLEEPVRLVSYSSQDVIPGTLFVVKGAHFRPEYLADAARKGAICYVAETQVPGTDLPHVLVNDIRKAAALLAQKFYDEPWKRLHVTGITGTKGKSTTTFFVKAALDAWEKACGKPGTGIISTIVTYSGKERFESKMTTPEPLDVERHFYNAAESGIQYVTMEVSSQALKYDRVLGVHFDTAAFLNIGYDHISPVEHPTWEDYFESKLKIFSQCNTAVVNLDSEHAKEILARAKEKARKVLTFSLSDERADFCAEHIESGEGESQFTVKVYGTEVPFSIELPGTFNVSNALAAIAICASYGVPVQYMQEGLAHTKVPGRMEVYRSKDGLITAIVDYAHNQLSFQKLFQTARQEYPDRRIVIVFGAPGGKALDRRHDLGDVAGQYADHCYLTEDDPGEEDAVTIDREIAKAVAARGCPYEIVPDRVKAIQKAVLDVKEPTVLLVAGKGAEARMKRGTVWVPAPPDGESVKKAFAVRERGL